MIRICVFVAEGFGVGRLPCAPGTFGTLVGMLWFFVLLAPRSLPLLIAGTAAGLAGSVWCCGVAERELGKTDPGSVVLDEITATPLCFVGWLTWYWSANHVLPTIHYFTRSAALPMLLITFTAFRLFDIWKPWPVRQSQRFAGGLGITMDDILAGIYAALVTGAAAFVIGPKSV